MWSIIINHSNDGSAIGQWFFYFRLKHHVKTYQLRNINVIYLFYSRFISCPDIINCQRCFCNYLFCSTYSYKTKCLMVKTQYILWGLHTVKTQYIQWRPVSYSFPVHTVKTQYIQYTIHSLWRCWGFDTFKIDSTNAGRIIDVVTCLAKSN